MMTDGADERSARAAEMKKNVKIKKKLWKENFTCNFLKDVSQESFHDTNHQIIFNHS